MKSNYKTEKYIVCFTELGDYENLEYWTNDEKKAEAKLQEWMKEYDAYFGYIAEIQTCVGKEVK